MSQFDGPSTLDLKPKSLQSPPKEPAWRKVACFLVLLVAIHVALGQKIQVSQWFITAERNPCIAEGAAWAAGRLDITPPGGVGNAEERLVDTALYNGKMYNAYPPLIPFLTYILAPINKALMGSAEIWQPQIAQLLLYWPLLLLAYWVFSRELGDSAWGAVMTFAYFGGTALLGSLHFSRVGEKCQMMQLASQTGIFLVLLDILGKRRIWPAILGLMIATWSRQLTIFYVIPILWAAWVAEPQVRARRILMVIAGIVVIVAPFLILSYLKFGDPFQSGYGYFYEQRHGGFLEDRFHKYGLFSWRFVSENFFYGYVAWPAFDVQLDGLHIGETQSIGTSAFITTPLLLWAFISARFWWKSPVRRVLMLATIPIILGQLLYHGMGYIETGYFRFALDFIPVWLVVTCPWMCGRASDLGLPSWKTPRKWPVWFTVSCIAWSVLYFNLITANAYLQVRVSGPDGKEEMKIQKFDAANNRTSN